jgi:tetratricopeptide (TPR) repeat protein
MAAQARMDHGAIASLALRLGERLEETAPDDARATYQMGLDAAPADLALMRALLAHLGSDDQLLERAELLARMLEICEGDEAAAIAIELSEVHTRLDDPEAAQRALVTGSRRAPGSPDLRARLESAYEERGDYRGLAAMLLRSADEQTDVRDQVVLLRRAAQIHRELLSDPSASADLLRKAHERAPADADLALELASGLAAAGDPAEAGTIVGRLLDALPPGDAQRGPLLLLRADLARGQGHLAGAIEALEAALPLDAQGARPALIDALHERISEAVGDVPAERAATLRLVDLLEVDGRGEQARTLLAEWCERERKDGEALARLRGLETAAGNWESVAKICARLIAISSGEEQVEAALGLAEAAIAAGKPGDAKPGLEHARRKQPDEPRVREALRSIYEAMGASGELAKLLLFDAEGVADPAERLALLRRAADLMVEAGEVDAALPVLAQIVELMPGDLVATVTLADAHTSLGDLDTADGLLDTAMSTLRGRRTPELALLQHRKARLAGARGDHQGQLELLQQAYLTDKNNGQIAAELADLAEAVEAYDLAVKVLRTITLLEDSPISRTEAFLRQAKIAHRRGDRQRAVLWAKKAKHETPDAADVDAFLAELGEE